MKAFFGFIIGALLGFPASYFCQNKMIREKMSLGDYVSHASDIFETLDNEVEAVRNIGITAIVVMVVCGILFAVLFSLLLSKKK